MKKLLVFLVVVALMVAGQQEIFGQMSRNEQNRLSLLESEITQKEKTLSLAEKNLGREKNRAQFLLRQELRKLELQSDPRRAASMAEIEWAKTQIEIIKTKMDSIESVVSTTQIDIYRNDLLLLQKKRQEMMAEFIDQPIPRQMSRLTKNRHRNSNVVRREELVLGKIENNIGSTSTAAIDPARQETGYKVIFDNKNSQSVTFILNPLDGGERLAINLAPRTRVVNYILPGRYLVYFYVNGRKREDLSAPLTIDGTRHQYEGENCFGFVYKARF